MTIQAVITQLVTVFIDMTGNTVFIETQVSPFLVDRIIIAKTGRLYIAGFVAQRALLVAVFAFKHIAGFAVIKIILALRPEDWFVVTPMMFRVATRAFFTFNII